LFVLCWLHAVSAEATISAAFPVPDVLRPNIAFWKRVFAVLDNRSGMLHDPDDVTIVYHTLTNLPESASQRQDVIDTYRARYRRILETLAQGKRHHLDHDEERVLALFKGKQSPAVLREAAEKIRFQPGIRDRFAEGVVRSVAHLADIERIFAAAGLPRELALLPHVESSFHSKARSKAGAAGMWQFMPATGKRFLRIDHHVDERLDVRLSTIAATKLLRENYEELGTWPLAITAYNHGTNGMKQAVATVGSRDFGTIVQHYKGPLFGFASKNFYAEFLAVLEVIKHHKVYFAELSLPRSPYIRTAEAEEAPRAVVAAKTAVGSREYRVQPGDTLSEIARQFDTTASTLAVLNRIQERDTIKPGQVLALPSTTFQQTVAERSPAPEQAPPPKRTPTKRYEVRPGDTLWGIAQRFDTTVPTLVALNGLKEQQAIKPGEVLSLPSTSSQTASAAPAPRQPAPAPKSYEVRVGDTLWGIAQRFGTTVPTLVALNGLKQRQQIKPGQVLALPATSQETAALTQYAVTPASYVPKRSTAPRLPESGDWLRVRRGTIRVAAKESLGHYAEWLDVPVQRLRKLNRLSRRQSLALGRRLRLDFSRVSVVQFSQRRKAFHHRIARELLYAYHVDGVTRHTLQPGETLWALYQEYDVPLWLLQRYNTHLQPHTLQPDTELRLPQVVERAS
jgi:membrane-bound lytic murein transglycosylase D